MFRRQALWLLLATFFPPSAAGEQPDWDATEKKILPTAEPPPRSLAPRVLIGAPLVDRRMLLQEPRLGAIKQLARGGGAGLWLIGDKGALLVDAGYSPRQWIDFPHPAVEVLLLDLEGDGNEEFIVRSRVLGHHGFFDQTFLLDSAGSERRFSQPLGWASSLTAGDLDGDGRAELVALGSWQKEDSDDFERGIVIMDYDGQPKQEIPADGLEQIFLADREGDGRPDIISLDSRGYLQVHAPAGITAFITRIEHPISEATLCTWPDGRQRLHLLYLHETSVWLIDTLTGESLRFDAPLAATGSVAGAVGVPVRLRKERPTYLAVAARLENRQSILYLLTPKGRVEYLEVLDEPVGALAAVESGAGVQELLVGGRGRVWAYRFLEEQWENLAETVWRVLAFGTLDIKLADVEVKNVARQLREGWFEWTVFIEGSEEALSQIGCVQYSLSPTFPNPNQLVCERGAGPRPFALTREGWGMFTMPVRLYLKSGPVQELYHRIRF